MRKTILGDDLPEFQDRVELRVKTNAPTKYLLIDSETGQVYRGKTPDEKAGGYDWRPIKLEEKKLIEAILKRIER